MDEWSFEVNDLLTEPFEEIDPKLISTTWKVPIFSKELRKPHRGEWTRGFGVLHGFEPNDKVHPHQMSKAGIFCQLSRKI